jgi:hypothetical protein
MKPEPSTEFRNFENVTRRVLSVSKEEIQRRLEAEKLANAGKPKRGPKPKKAQNDQQ